MGVVWCVGIVCCIFDDDCGNGDVFFVFYFVGIGFIEVLLGKLIVNCGKMGKVYWVFVDYFRIF